MALDPMQTIKEQLDNAMKSVGASLNYNFGHVELWNRTLRRIFGPLPGHPPSTSPVSQLTKSPGIPALFPNQSFRLTGEYLLLCIRPWEGPVGVPPRVQVVEDEGRTLHLMALWNHTGQGSEKLQAPFITPTTTSDLFPPVILLKEPFLHCDKDGCTGIWVLHWLSDLVWVDRHADCVPKQWHLGPKPGNEAEFWNERARRILDPILPTT